MNPHPSTHRGQAGRRPALASLFALALAAAPAPSTAAPAAADRPNIILILADDVGQEVLGCYGGSSYPTPRIDALAAGGARFEHAYSMPVCHPTRLCLLTGRYPFRFSGPSAGWGRFPAEEEGRTLAQVLRRAGYATAVAGKWQLALLKRDPEHPLRLGFDHWSLFGWHEGARYYDPFIYEDGVVRAGLEGRYGPDVYREFLAGFMRQSRERERPFFAFYSMALCHDVTDDLPQPVPYAPGKDRYDTYAEMVAQMDRQVGLLVAAVEELGLREDTLIIFTGDNGTPGRVIARALGGRKFQREPVVSRRGGREIPGGKGKLTDDGTRVPFIARWPGTIAPGQVRGELLDFSDLLPTFAELAGADPPAGVTLDGRSFAPLLRGETGAPPHRDWVFAEARGGRRWVRDTRWKLYRDGRFFDLRADPLEKGKPLTIPVARASGPAAEARRKLAGTLEALGARPDPQ